MSKNKETTQVQNPAMLAVGSMPDVLVWRLQSGLFRAYNTPAKLVRVGSPGMADCMAVVKVTITPDMVGKTIGHAVAAEFKLPTTGKQQENQKDWQKAFEQRGGVYKVVRSAVEMLDLVNDVKSGKLL